MIVNKKQNGISPIVAAVTGVVVGAGIAVAGAVALNDEKNREKVKDVIANAKEQTLDFIEILKIKPDTGEEINKIKKIAKNTKKVVEKNI